MLGDSIATCSTAESGSGQSPSRFRLAADRRAEALERRRLRAEMNTATRTGGFVLHYQPRFCLHSGRPAGAEALIRWPHRRRGLIPPAACIPYAEESGRITRIGEWVMRTACNDAAGWAGGVVSVNVSARQLSNQTLLLQIATALEQSGLPAERLEIELTESTLADTSLETLLTLSAIRDLGVGLALDDFGTGFASLAMLKRLPLTAMKLDRSLVREVPEHREDAVIARAVIAAARALGLQVVAEGIETETQRAFLAGSGCDEGQGYLFSQPIPEPELRRQLGGAESAG